MIYLIIFIGALTGSLLGNYLWSKRKWRLILDEKTKELRLETNREIFGAMKIIRHIFNITEEDLKWVQ